MRQERMKRITSLIGSEGMSAGVALGLMQAEHLCNRREERAGVAVEESPWIASVSLNPGWVDQKYTGGGEGQGSLEEGKGKGAKSKLANM